MTKQSFIRGTLILIFAGLITRILGFINRIVIARIMGAEGVGLYVMAVPTLLLIITLTQIGLPVAISKLVAEAEAVKDRKKIKQILVVSLTLVSALCVIFTTAMIVFAPIIAKHFLTDERAYYPLVAISPIVPIVALSSVLRGYFQGLQNMRPTAYSQVIEQIVRITLVAVMTSLFLPYGIEFAAAGAMISVVIGELASLIYMLLMFRHKKNFHISKSFSHYLSKGKSTFNELMAIALPTTGSRLIGSVSYFFEPIVVAQSLAVAGVATAIATKQYGELAGYAIPLIQLPTFITYSLSVSLVPAISEAAAQSQHHLIYHRLNQALRLALISGGLAVIILYVFAEPIMELMYHAPEVAIYLKVMAPLSIFLFFQGPLQATLQALNLAKAAMMNSLFGAIIKISAIFVLTSRPELGILGAAIAVVIGFVLVTLLHFVSVIKTISFTIEIPMLLKTALVIVSTGFVGHFLYTSSLFSFGLLIDTLLAITICTLFYFVMAIGCKLITEDELKRIPVLGKWLIRLA